MSGDDVSGDDISGDDVSGYDVIGDVHGMHGQLVGLLRVLGHREHGGVWSHPEGRRLVFVGDVIDRGPNQRSTVRLVRSLVDQGVAHLVMGNHEWNAISYATPSPTGDGHLRERNDKHRRQHAAFLEEYDVDGDDHLELVEWFRTLPLWLDLGGLRVVHACWSPSDIAVLAAHLAGGRVTDDLLVAAADTTSPEHRAIEHVLKGPEVALDERHWYLDKDGHLRTRARYRWWAEGPMTLRHRAQALPQMRSADGGAHPGFDDTPITSPVEPPSFDDGPVIVGHYWFTGERHVLGRRSACVDYSAGKGGPLVAYRWSGEPDLDDANFRHHG